MWPRESESESESDSEHDKGTPRIFCSAPPGLGSELLGTGSTSLHAWARRQALFNDAVAVASRHHETSQRGRCIQAAEFNPGILTAEWDTRNHL